MTKLNSIQFDIISPHWERFDDNSDWDDRYVEYAQISIIIDGKDLLKDLLKEYEHLGQPRYAGTDPGSFLFPEDLYGLKLNRLNSTLLIGVCNVCFFEMCDDLYAEVSTENNIVKWKIIPDRIENVTREYLFEINNYTGEIEKLNKKYNSYDWEDRNHKIRRLCNQYIKEFKTKNDKIIERVTILGMLDDNGNDSDLLSNTMYINYIDQELRENKIETVYKHFTVEWDGETLESALENLKMYAEQNLIKI
jgi:hypothetical protein